MNLQQAKEQIKRLQLENFALKEAQKEFQDQLIKEVERINNLPPFKRWFTTAKLLINLLDTIVEAIDKAKKKG